MTVVDQSDSPKVEHESLWWLTLPPLIWVAHFFACYLTAAVYCAKSAAHDAPLTTVRWAVGAYTALALCGAALCAWRGLRHRRWGVEGSWRGVPLDFDSPGDRHRFLGLASLLLSGLVILGTLFVALPALFLETCR